MAGLATIMTVTLAAVFALAAGSKIRRPRGDEMHALGLPYPRALAVVVPIVELATAIALLVAPRSGAVAAIVLLAAFTAVLVRTIRSGRGVSCGCLGSLSDEPVTWTTVLRNGALAVMAVVVAAATSGPDRLTGPDLPAVLAFVGYVVVVSLSGQLLATRQQLGRLWSVQLAGEPATGI